MSSHVAEVVTLKASDFLKANPSLLAQFPGNSIKDAEGVLRHTLGPRIEEPGTYQLFIDWESFEHNKKVRAQLNIEELQEKFEKLLTTPPEVHYVPFAPFNAYTKSVAAPTTEIIFAITKDSTDIQHFDKITEETLIAAGNAEGCLSWAFGHSIDKSSKLAILILGWESIEAHEKFHDTEAFRLSTAPFIELVSEVKMFNVNFSQQK